MIPPKRFDIFPPDWGMLRRSRRVLNKKGKVRHRSSPPRQEAGAEEIK